MKDGIKTLQLTALDYITENHLEGEYNHYWVCGDYITGYTAIDFVIKYCTEHVSEIKG